MIEILLKCDRCGKSDSLVATLSYSKIGDDGRIARQEVTTLDDVSGLVGLGRKYRLNRHLDRHYLLCKECQRLLDEEIREESMALNAAQHNLSEKKSEFFSCL